MLDFFISMAIFISTAYKSFVYFNFVSMLVIIVIGNSEAISYAL